MERPKKVKNLHRIGDSLKFNMQPFKVSRMCIDHFIRLSCKNLVRVAFSALSVVSLTCGCRLDLLKSFQVYKVKWFAVGPFRLFVLIAEQICMFSETN